MSRDHAVVLGAGIGGLLAARALREHYDRITVVDRDELPDGPAHRRGTPQDRHPHLLLARGAQVVEDLCPGVLADLVEAGTPVLHRFGDTHLSFGGHLLSRDGPTPEPMYLTSRINLENCLRVRTADHATIRPRTTATGLVHANGAVTGVRLQTRSGDEELAADLVVDATGRSGRATTWLTELGYEGIFDAFGELAPPGWLDPLLDASPQRVAVHRFPSSLRRRYERMRSFPRGLLVVGDGLCSFNPLYGQGMTIAALQAATLRQTLAEGDDDLARRYFAAAARHVDVAWRLSVAGDLAYPNVPGPRPAWVGAMNRMVDVVLLAAETDPEVRDAFLRVSWLLDPPSRLATRRFAARVLRDRLLPARAPSGTAEKEVVGDRRSGNEECLRGAPPRASTALGDFSR